MDKAAKENSGSQTYFESKKTHNYAFLTVEQIEKFLSHFVFDNPTDMKIRKFLINAFVREVILYDDEVVITYNFTDSPEHLKVNKEQTLREEQQIERAKSSFSFDSGSTILAGSPPKAKGAPAGAPFAFGGA